MQLLQRGYLSPVRFPNKTQSIKDNLFMLYSEL